MFGKRCTLCGGKLDSRKICKECGLNNNQSEKYYKINQSSCDGMPLTHAHENNDEKRFRKPDREYSMEDMWKNMKHPVEDTKRNTAAKTARYSTGDTSRGKTTYKAQTTTRNTTYSSTKKVRTSDSDKKAGMVKWIVIIATIATIGGSVLEMIDNNGFGSMEEWISSYADGGEITYDSDTYPYEMLEERGESIAEEGEEFETELSSGQYIVGVHIPEGNYVAQPQNGYDLIKVADGVHDIYLFEYEEKEEKSYLEDLRLFNGAVVTISAGAPMTLFTENAQPMETSVSNPLTDIYELEGSEKLVAGKDYKPGVYDFTVMQGDGEVNIIIYDENIEEYRTYNLSMGTNGSEGSIYRNMVLPEHAVVQLEDWGSEEEGEYRIQMSPSPIIETEEYMSIYENHMNY